MRKIAIVLITLILIGVGILSGCTEQPTSETKDENQSPKATCDANPTTGTAPFTVTFLLDANDTDGSISSWKLDINNDGTPEYSDSGNPPPEKQHTYTTPGTYIANFTVIDNKGATDSDTITILVNEKLNSLPIATASANRTSGEVPLVVQFTGSGTDPNGTIVSYYWDFNNGHDSHYQNPTQNFSEVGTYNVTLTITNDQGETDTDTITITVVPHLPEWHLLRHYSGTGDPENDEIDVIQFIPNNSEKWKIEWSVDPGKGYYDNFLSVSVVNDTNFDHHYKLLVNWNSGESPTSGIVEVNDDNFRFGSMDFTISTMPGTPFTLDIYQWN
jgi:hypothetical protein